MGSDSQSGVIHAIDMNETVVHASVGLPAAPSSFINVDLKHVVLVRVTL